jgi:hypothetical protein
VGIDESRGGDDGGDQGGCGVFGSNGGDADVREVDESRRGDDGGDQRGCGVLGPNGGDAYVREVVEWRRWDDGGGRGAAETLLSVESTVVEAGTVAAAGAVTCMLTRALPTWPTLSSGTADASAWSASMLLRVEEKKKVVTLPF